MPRFGAPSALRAPAAAKDFAAPQVSIDASAEERCPLYRLPANPTQAELETGYTTRGTQILTCDGRRQLAADTLEAEHRLQAQFTALQAKRAQPWWRRWLP